MRKAYTLTITREAAPGSDDASLYDMTGSPGYLDFRRDTTTYRLFVKHDLESLVLTPSTLHPQATVTVNGEDPVTPVALDYGENLIEVVVTAADGVATQTYDVTVIRSPTNPDPGDFSALIAQIYEWRNDPQSAPSRRWTQYATTITTYATHRAYTDRWDRALLALGATLPDASLTPMSAVEAQTLADRGSAWWRTLQPDWIRTERGKAEVRRAWSRWVEVAAALRHVESAQNPEETRAALIARMYEWRNDPQWVGEKDHTDRWDRALLAFGETVADTTLSPMTAAEAQAFADRGDAWSRWVEVAAALRELEAARQQQQGTPNRAPTVSAAIADATIVSESGTKQASLYGVFADADNDSLTITAASSDEAKATVSVASDGSSLTATAKDRGTATITVTADDGNGGTVDDSFTVTVKAAPVVVSALADVSGLEAGATREVSLSGVFSDADGDSLTITAASSDETKATVSIASDGSSLTLTGVFEGTTTVTVTVQDTDGNRVSDAFDVEVAASQQKPNQAPTVSVAIVDATIVSESGTKQVPLSGVFSDADNDALTMSAVSSDDAVATVSVASDGSSLTVSAQDRGTATITVTADDGNGGTVEDAFTVTVKAAPVVASAISDVSGLEAGATRDVSLSGVFSDPDGDSLTISAASSDETKATVKVASDGSKLTLTGVAEDTATITVTAEDSDGNRVSDTFDVSVGEKYAALIAQMYEWRNDPRWVGEKSHTDRWDRALLAFGETVSDTTLTPMTAAEAQGFADSGMTRWVSVAAALRELEAAGQQQGTPNRAPTVSAAMADATIVSQSGTNQVSLSGVFSDADSDSLTVTAASSDEAVATVSVANDSSSLTVTARSRGTATITATADDGSGGKVDDVFTVTVKAAPVVASNIGDVSGLEAGATREVSLSGVFSDPDGDSLTITAESDEAIATVSVASDGSNLTLAGVSEGTATVTVTAEDSDGNSVSDAFDVEVAAQQQEPPNQAPTVSAAIADATIVTTSGTHQASLSGVFADADNDALTITAASSNEAVATVTVESDVSSLTVTAKARGTATITVTAADGNGGTADDTFTVTVKTAPVVASSISDVSGLEAGATREVSLSGVFSDTDGDSLTVTAASSDETKATVVVESDGSKLTLTGVAEGTATITVTAQDSDGNRVSDAFQVSVTKAVEPEPPPLNPETSDVVERYDANGDGAIDLSEYSQAARDYAAGKITYAEFLEVIRAFQGGG